MEIEVVDGDSVRIKGATVIVSVSGALRSGRPEANPRTSRLVNVPGGALPATDIAELQAVGARVV